MSLEMKSTPQAGYYLFQKSQGPGIALKDMLQFVRTQGPGKGLQFAHVESENSLMPHLSLWENVHVVTGGSSWRELISSQQNELQSLFHLIPNPDIRSMDATPWERLIVSLIKATLMNSQHVIVEVEENLLSPLNLLNFKKMLTHLCEKTNVYISTRNTELWLDAAHSLITRDGYQFIVEIIDPERVKSIRSA
jgi:hypothetical protein